jgi:type II restriction enzyme
MYTAAMRLELDLHLADGYKSPSQRARVMTEGWFAENMYCAACPSAGLVHTRASTQVVDFVCDSCGAEYQVKAKAGPLGPRLRDAAYAPMIERARENRSPHFAFLGYDSERWRVRGLLLVPGHFITPDVIQPCKALGASARRAGWVGCNILVDRIPPDGRLAVVQGDRIVPPGEVRHGWDLFADLSRASAAARGWSVDVLRCVRSLAACEFRLRDFYERFERHLALLHPDNRNVQPKIRQQLQVLRDRGIVRFLGRGRYVVE